MQKKKVAYPQKEKEVSRQIEIIQQMPVSRLLFCTVSIPDQGWNICSHRLKKKKRNYRRKKKKKIRKKVSRQIEIIQQMPVSQPPRGPNLSIAERALGNTNTIFFQMILSNHFNGNGLKTSQNYFFNSPALHCENAI